MDTAERNKRRVLDGVEEFAKGNVEFLRTVLAEDFVEHSPGNPSGRDAFIAFIAQAPVAGAELELKRVVADDQYVVLHYAMHPASGPASAVVDIWRMDDGMITEHWDVVQPVPDPEETPHGMF